MALSFRALSAAPILLLALGLGASCTPKPEVAANKAELAFRDKPAEAGRDTVAILTPVEAETEDLWASLVQELGEEFNVVTVPMGRGAGSRHLARELERYSPSCVVVVDNRTLEIYRELQAQRPLADFPPAVVVMTSFLDRAIGGLRHATGIAYEVPAVSSIVALREVSQLDVQRVGVVHRERFEDVVALQTQLAALEKVQLVPVSVPNEPSPEAVEDSLDRLVVDENVDALWVVNDNRLLTPELLINSWLPVLRFRPIPVIVGVSALVHPEVHFGTLAVTPNHAELGVQAANLVFDLADNDWILGEERQVELPLRVMTVVDVKQVDDYFGLKADALAKIDQAVK
jgi:hypothetical protein